MSEIRSPRRQVLKSALSALVLGTMPLGAWADANKPGIKVGGTGAALAFMHAAATSYGESGTEGSVEVIEGLGSSGAVRALAAGAIDVAITGRALRESETQADFVEIPLMQTPFGLFTSRRDEISILRDDVWRLYSHPGAQNVLFGNRPVRVILRPEADSDQSYAKSVFPGFEDAYELARSSDAVPIAQTDQENADLAEKLQDSLTTGTLLQMIGENRDLRPILIDGIAPTPQSVADGTYPYAKTLYVVHRKGMSPAVEAFVAYIFSDTGVQTASELGGHLLR